MGIAPVVNFYSLFLCFLLSATVLYAATSAKLWKAMPPINNSKDRWIARTKSIDLRWNQTFLFFDNKDYIHIVKKNGSLYKAQPLTNGPKSWLGEATLMGNGPWNKFKSLFFHPSGDLYGVYNDKIYKGTPPAQDGWLARATLIGNAGWNAFKFLFFDNKGLLNYYVHD